MCKYEQCVWSDRLAWVILEGLAKQSSKKKLQLHLMVLTSFLLSAAGFKVNCSDKSDLGVNNMLTKPLSIFIIYGSQDVTTQLLGKCHFKFTIFHTTPLQKLLTHWWHQALVQSVSPHSAYSPNSNMSLQNNFFLWP